MTGRRPNGDELLDARLRAAASELADEPLPDGVLDAGAATPRIRKRIAPLLLAAAAGLLAVVVGIRLAQVGLPTTSDASPAPSPAGSSEPARTPDPTGTPAPSPSTDQTPGPSADAGRANLVTAGSTCGDGTGGYAFMVPDGWFANRAWFDAPACRYLADAPFDPPPSGVELDWPILIRTSADALPARDATEVEAAVPTETADRFATRYAVVRDGVAYVEFVVSLIATIEGTPAYLHLGARRSNADAVAALETIVQGLVVREPLTVTADAAAQADALFAAGNIDGCVNVELGFATAFPASWWTNAPLGDLPGCVFFAPTSFAIPDDPSQVPDGVAITINLVESDVGTTFGEIIGYETTIVDGSPAVRWELVSPADGALVDPFRSYQVIVQIGEIPEVGPSLVLGVATAGTEATDEYQLHRAVLDRLIERLHISPAPSEVVEREPLPSCGQEVVTRLAEGDTSDAAARDCLWEAYESGEPAEFISLHVTIEGARILDIWRVIGPGEVELYADATHDHGGSMTWSLHRCTSIDGARSEDGASIFFGLGACIPPIELDSERRP